VGRLRRRVWLGGGGEVSIDGCWVCSSGRTETETSKRKQVHEGRLLMSIFGRGISLSLAAMEFWAIIFSV
jgi:hypothetical protein